jgi:hypothetical protein
MEDLLAKAMTMGGAGLGLAQQLMTSIRSDKPADDAKKVPLPIAGLKITPAPVAHTNGKVDPVTV